MPDILEKEDLFDNLGQLKEVLGNINFNTLDNVIFLNIDSFYHFVNCLTAGKNSVQEILDKIEPYMPYFLSEYSLEFFIIEAVADSDNLFNDLYENFKWRNRVDFINIVYSIDNHEDWLKFLNLCEDIRIYFAGKRVPALL